MPDDHYLNPKLAELYDHGNPWSIDRDFYLSLAGQPCSRILDLGCGTGLLADAYAAKGHAVTGVDPSPAMLAVARRKNHGSEIQWVPSLAQSYRSDTRFDLIVMTGHAFQTLLEDEDVGATFDVMRKHLKPDGVLAFESRNPAIDWKSRWDYDVALDLPGGGVVHESRRFLTMNGDRLTFELRFRFPDETIVSRSELRFLSCTEIENRLAESGMRIDRVLGNWDASPFDETCSQEMIFIARARASKCYGSAAE